MKMALWVTGGDEGDVRLSFPCLLCLRNRVRLICNLLFSNDHSGVPPSEPYETVVQWAGNHLEAVGRPDSTPA